jgi:D-alanine-D-alanine ligase
MFMPESLASFSHSVLILHNAPDSSAADAGFGASDGGVLDQVAAVGAALGRLGVAYRTAAVARLDDVPVALAEGTEAIVFNLVESLRPRADDAVWVPALCQAMGRACTGGDSRALFVTQDKGVAQSLFARQGISVPPFVCVARGTAPAPEALPALPLMVKPVSADASEGIDDDAVVFAGGPVLERAVRRVHERFAQNALVERYIEGREFNVSVIRAASGPQALPVAEILFEDYPDDKPRIVNYAAKWDPASFAYRHTPRQIPAVLDTAQAEALRRTALAVWNATEGADFMRVDMRMDDRGRIYVLEANVNPDLSPDAGFAAALAAADISFDDFIRQTVRHAEGRLAVTAWAPDGPSADADEGMPGPRRAEAVDRERIMQILRATRFFRPDELAIAGEVLDESLQKGADGHYQSFVMPSDAGSARGWICYGATPCTLGTWDIYWLAVDPQWQGCGIGRTLMRHAEARIRQAGGRLCVAETGGRASYAPTRQFYERVGYALAGRIPDFYAPGDDQCVYVRDLG